MKTQAMKRLALLCGATAALWFPAMATAQINVGSNGSDGALDFSGITVTTNVVIDMHDHPNGIYQYTYVNIPTNVTVTFIPNANNTPVTWLAQSSCVISGTVDLSGQCNNGIDPGQGGPGGGAGGRGGQTSGSSWIALRGNGLGGGDPGVQNPWIPVGGAGSYAAGGSFSGYAVAGLTYGNKFLLPLLGGSGGGGGFGLGGGGGGGAILIASDNSILVDGIVKANGGCGGNYNGSGAGGGSGGGVRLLTPLMSGHGFVTASGGSGACTWLGNCFASGGAGFVRLDTLDDQFAGTLTDLASRGFNPVLVAPAQTASLVIQSIAGNAVSANPTGFLYTPDVTVSAQQTNPIPIVVSCVNVPLNTPITVVVKPTGGATVLGSTMNTAGTQVSSTATVSIVMPRGGGLIYATAATSH